LIHCLVKIETSYRTDFPFDFVVVHSILSPSYVLFSLQTPPFCYDILTDAIGEKREFETKMRRQSYREDNFLPVTVRDDIIY